MNFLAAFVNFYFAKGTVLQLIEDQRTKLDFVDTRRVNLRANYAKCSIKKGPFERAVQSRVIKFIIKSAIDRFNVLC